MIHPPVNKLTVAQNATLKTALAVINEFGLGVCFIVDEQNKVIGILTDGDVRRALLSDGTTSTPVDRIMNRNFLSLPVDVKNEELLQRLNKRIRIIPLVDEDGKLMDYATIGKLRRIPIAGPFFNGNELEYVTECIKTSWVSSQGKFIAQFQDNFKERFNQPVALAVSNGTVAIHLALAALGIGKGDEVIVPDFTFAATINAVLYTGATPVLADIELDSWTISIDAVKKKITSKTKAIIPVHIYGHPCKMDELMQIAREHDLLIIEDCAEALGSLYKNKPIGSFGDAATFSFFGNKTITTGEGGMVLFKNEEAGMRAQILRDHGMSPSKRYWHVEVGFNYRMTNMQAALGVAQMEQLDTFVEKKRSIARLYNDALKDVDYIIRPPEMPWAYNSYWLYTFILKEEAHVDREELLLQMLRNGVEGRPTFYPLHQMPIYKDYGDASELENSIFLSKRGISLPSSVNITDEELEYAADTVCDLMKAQVVKNV